MCFCRGTFPARSRQMFLYSFPYTFFFFLLSPFDPHSSTFFGRLSALEVTQQAWSVSQGLAMHTHHFELSYGILCSPHPLRALFYCSCFQPLGELFWFFCVLLRSVPNFYTVGEAEIKLGAFRVRQTEVLSIRSHAKVLEIYFNWSSFLVLLQKNDFAVCFKVQALDRVERD